MSKVVVIAVAALAVGGGLFMVPGYGEPTSADETSATAGPPSQAEASASAGERIGLAAVANPDASKAAQDGFPLTGVVKIKGDVPRRRKVRMDADPKCAALHAEAPLDETIVADKDGNVQWACVFVRKGAEGKKGPEPPKAVINQEGCQYKPHVLGVMVGQEITILNSDELLHNIHALPFANKEFNFGQPQKGMVEKKSFTTVEVPVKIKCDIHPWMGAWAIVLDHSFFSVTDPAGKFEIKGLPPGKYTIEAWHEAYKSVTVEVEVKGPTTQNFELTEKKG